MGTVSTTLRVLLTSLQDVVDFYDSLFQSNSNVFAFQSYLVQKESQRRRQWVMLLPYTLLWPLVAPANRASMWKTNNTSNSVASQHAHTYHIDLRPLHADFPQEKANQVRMTVFNPLASVKCAGQHSTGYGVCADMFVCLDALANDLICTCGKHSVPPHWNEYFLQNGRCMRMFA